VTKQLWAPWRLSYVQQAGEEDGCVFCREVAGELGDDSLVVHRGETGLVLLNKFPYSSGHLMVAPLRHVASLEELTESEVVEVHRLTSAAVAALRSAYSPDAFNVGWNLGEVAGGSITGHLHEHVVPRWAGDTNYMSTVAGTRVIPEDLRETYQVVKEAWPKP